MTDWGIPSLLPDKLAAVVPTCVYAGGLVTTPSNTLFVWRTCTFPKETRGGVLAFYTDDYRFEGLWNNPERYAEQFARFGWGAIVEPDFSTWADTPLAEQLWSIYRMRTVGRLYQEHGLNIIPNLAWSDERSFEFCFQGIPQHPPVAAVECRTAGQTDEDRRTFLTGLAEGVRHVQPAHVIVYGGAEHRFWLESRLPPGPQYTLLESWTHCRDRIRIAERRLARTRNQLKLFPSGGNGQWADEAAAAAALAVHA